MSGASGNSEAADVALVRATWRRTCRQLGLAGGAEAAVEPVIAAYQHPLRFYHGIHHIAALLREVEAAQAACDDPDALATAVIFHDYIYDPTRRDNEERSAEAAVEVLRRFGAKPEVIECVRRLVLATKHDGRAVAGDEALIVDIDLSGLGKPPAAFDADTDAVRREYPHVDDDAFITGRANFLQNLLNRPHVYLTPAFRDRHEAAARVNLKRAVERLS